MKQHAFLLMALLSVFSVQAQVTLKSIPFPLHWENSPKTFRITGNNLIIESGAKTDMFRDPNVTYNTDNAPKLLFSPDEHFVFTASVHHAFASKWDGGALVLKTDSAHWVKCCYEKDYTGARRVVTVVTDNISDDCNSLSFPSNKVFFKIAKADNVITLYCGTDGKKWFLIRHFQYNAKGPMQLGFLSQSPEGKNCTVTFSNITYTAKKIADPYTGE